MKGSIKAVIVDDQKDFRDSLKADILDYCNEIEIIGEASGVVDAAKMLNTREPEIVFLDIDLGDGTGFDLLDILHKPIQYRIIFTTSSDSHAIRAFRYSAIDYLMKPVDPEELIHAVQKFKEVKQDPEQFELLKENVKSNSQINKIALSSLDKIKIAEVSDIVRCESQGNYTDFYFTNGTKLMISKTLKEYDEILSQNSFIRVHQSHLVNAEFIKEFVKSDGGYLTLKDGSNIPVSTRRKSFVIDYLTNII
jgi:two-component system LytT family response regulator